MTPTLSNVKRKTVHQAFNMRAAFAKGGSGAPSREQALEASRRAAINLDHNDSGGLLALVMGETTRVIFSADHEKGPRTREETVGLAQGQIAVARIAYFDGERLGWKADDFYMVEPLMVNLKRDPKRQNDFAGRFSALLRRQNQIPPVQIGLAKDQIQDLCFITNEELEFLITLPQGQPGAMLNPFNIAPEHFQRQLRKPFP